MPCKYINLLNRGLCTMWPMQTSWVGMLQLSGKVLVLRGPQTRALRLCGLCLEIPNNFYRWLSFISQAAGEKRQCWRACSLSPHTFHLPYPLWMGSWLPAPSSLELGPHQESLSPSLPHDHCQLRHYSLSCSDQLCCVLGLGKDCIPHSSFVASRGLRSSV